MKNFLIFIYRFLLFVFIMPYIVFAIWNTSFDLFLTSLTNPAARFLNRLVFFAYRGFDSDFESFFFLTWFYEIISRIFS